MRYELFSDPEGRHRHGRHRHDEHRSREHRCGREERGFGRHGVARRHGRGWDQEGEGRGGRRRVFDSNELRLVLLKLIADQPRHGYDLIRAIEDLTGGAYAPSPGVVYPTLSLLQEMEQIDEAKADGVRKAFAITPAGTAHLAEHKAEVEELFQRLASLASMRLRTDPQPVRRAMDNLKTALVHRLRREDASAETGHAIAAILDEAAQRIERL